MRNVKPFIPVLVVVAVAIVAAAYYLLSPPPPDALGPGEEGSAGIRGEPLVQVFEHEELGKILTGPDGMTLYVFVNDEPNVSHCEDVCETNWPPLTLAPGQELVGGEGVRGTLGAMERLSGERQVTYDTKPLYYYIQDGRPGDATGDGVNDVWFAAAP